MWDIFETQNWARFNLKQNNNNNKNNESQSQRTQSGVISGSLEKIT